VSKNRLILASTTAIILLASASVRAQSVAPTSPATARPAVHPKSGLEEVVVTARRRAERAQTTPISVAVLSASALKQKNIQEVQDLNTVVPGFRFGSEGGKNTNNVTLRGLSKIPLGPGIPAVVEYFDDVPLPGLGSNIPFFDISNVQVFKGPQGTLFGRNTLGGAVVITPTQPNDKYGGYIDGTYGNYNHEDLTGAVNLPFIPDKVELRIAGEIKRQDGYIKNLSGGSPFSNTNENAWRVSLLLRPVQWLTNTTTYDYMVAPEDASGEYLIKQNKNAIPGLSPLIDPYITPYAIGQQKGGPFSAYADAAGSGVAFRRLQGLTNDTRIDVTDDIQIHNILGYRQAYNNQLINTGGVGPISLSLPGVPFKIPFTLFDAAEIDNQQYLTEEVQIAGHSFNNRLSWIIGGFMNDDSPVGAAGSHFVSFYPLAGVAPYTTSQITDHNYALYGQIGYDLSDWVKGLTFNFGYRYSWDQEHACGGSTPGGYANQATCDQIAALGVAGGPGVFGVEGSDPSGTVGLDYKLSSKQFFYITSRHGYRGVSLNTPLFSSVYTTGGYSPNCIQPGGHCPDLRPFQTTRPEKITDVEIGSKTDFVIGSMHGRFDIDGYWSKYSNAVQFFNVQGGIVYGGAPDNPTNNSIGINAANETIMGTEASFLLQPMDGLTVNLDGAYTNQVVDSIVAPPINGLTLGKGQITLPSPRFSGSIGVSYLAEIHPLKGDLLFTGDWYQTGKFSGQYGVNLPGYGVGNVRLSLNHVYNTGFDISLYCRNILDRAYLTGPTVLIPTFPVNTAVYAEPRTYAIEARYTF